MSTIIYTFLLCTINCLVAKNLCNNFLGPNGPFAVESQAGSSWALHPSGLATIWAPSDVLGPGTFFREDL